MARLKLVLVTLERQLLETECDEVSIPGGEGYLGILPGHSPLIAILKPGELHYRSGRDEGHVAISGGFCEIHNDLVTVLADRAELPEEIDVAAARAAEAKAEEELHRTLDESYVGVMDRLDEARTWIQVGSRRSR